MSCDEIARGTSWLAALNGKDGADETYGPAKWLTVYDGSGAADPAFAGPDYQKSPQLKNAENREFAGTYHNDLRVDPVIVKAYRTFIETADGGRQPAQQPSPPAVPGPVAPGPARPPIRQGVFSSAGGFVAPDVVVQPPAVTLEPAQPSADGEPPRRVATISVSTIGRHWSGAANAAMALLLAGGAGLLLLDRRRRQRVWWAS